MKKPIRNVLRLAVFSDIPAFHHSESIKGGGQISTSYVLPYIFEGLMKLDENSLPVKAVASEVVISRDQKTYTFLIKDDCMWSDGTQVTAHDFKYAWKKLIDPNSKSRCVSPELFYPIKNVENCMLGKCDFEEVGIIIDEDDKKIAIELEFPAPYFLEILSNAYFLPAPKHIAENDPEWCIKPGFVCNGPFTLKSHRINSEIELSKNPMYWDQKHVYLDGVYLYIFSDVNTSLNMFAKGELDWIGSPFVRMSYENSHKFLTERALDATVYFFNFNNEKYPLNNIKIRKALSYALDRASMCEHIFYDMATPTVSILPDSMKLPNKELFQDNNTTEAKKIFEEGLKEIGESIETFPKIELLYNADYDFSKLYCLAAQDQYRKVLGINVQLRGLSGRALFISSLQKGDYQMAISGFMSQCLYPSFILEIFENKYEFRNRSRWENEKFKEAIKNSKHSLNEIEKLQYLMKAEEILMEEMPVAPLFSVIKSYGKNPKLKGEYLTQLPFLDIKSAYFED